MSDFLELLRLQWDRALAVAALLVGGVALALGWFGASGEVLASEQIPYVISGGLFGIFCLGVAGVLWLSADLRDEWRELRRLAGRDAEAGDPSGPEVESMEARVRSLEEELVAVRIAVGRNGAGRRAPSRAGGRSGIH